MKRLTIALLVLAITTAAFAGKVISRGAKISHEAKTTALGEVLANPDQFTEKAVVVEGVIKNVCEMKGCWMELTPTASDAGVRITFKDYGFFVPTDSKGMKARAEGVAVVKTLSKEEADHLAGEGATLTRNDDGTAKEVSFVATGVELWK